MKTSSEIAAVANIQPAATNPALKGLNRLLYWRRYPGSIHAVLYVALAVLVYFAFNPARRSEGNLATEMVWKLWWPSLPFILLLGGRVWCGICPFGGISDLAGKLRKHPGQAPSALRRYGPWMGAISVFGFGLSFLALGLEMNTHATGYILIGMVVLAFGMSLLYKGRTFCRYLCPVGMITRVYSFFSWLRPAGSGVSYQSAACPVGQSPSSLRQPSQCQLCGTCTSKTTAGGLTSNGITAGFGAAAGRAPGVKEFGRPEALLSLLLLGLMAADSVRMTPMFARFQQFALPYFDYDYRLTVIVGVSGLVAAVLLSQLAAAWIISRRNTDSEAFGSMAFSYLPLTLGVFLALALQHLRYGLWPSIQTFLAESRIMNWDGHMPPENVYFTSVPLKVVQFAILGVGLYLSWKLARRGTGAADRSLPGVAARRLMVLAAAAGFGFLFIIPMSGAC